MQNYENNPDYKQYYSPQKPPKKSRTGLLVVLVVVSLLFSVLSWVINIPGKEEVEQTPVAEYPQPDAEPVAELDFSEPVRDPEPREEEFATESSAQGMENRPISDPNALSLQEIYEKVSPSTASIICTSRTGGSTGTGIVMSKDGYVITNFHVIEGAAEIEVLLHDDTTYGAELVGGDEISDIAVLKVDANDLTPAEFGDSNALRVGDVVVAIGDPLGVELRGTMTDGIVSAINRDLDISGRTMTLIQTNAALNSGNSGGPLINCYGQVIGINTMKMSNWAILSATVEGLGFAIPFAIARPIVDELIGQGYVSGRPAIGIRGETLSLRAQLFYRLPSGVVVTEVTEESDAYEQGMQVDDLIVAFDGISVSSLDGLALAKTDYEVGETVELTVFRDGAYYYVDVELVDQLSPDIY